MDPAEARRYRFEGEASAARTDGGVWSYGLCKMKAAQELRLKQVSFLRKVEQAEHALRNSMERGAVVPIRRYKGDMQRKFNLLSEEEQAAAAAQQGQQGQPLGQSLQSGQLSVTPGQGPGGLGQLQRLQQTYDDDVEDDETQSVGGSSMKRSRPIRDDGFEGTEAGYGETGLMYADVQLYTHCRRVSQLVFVQAEIRCLRRLFNSKWEASRAAKQKSLDRIDERLGRIVEIQKELTKLAVEEGAGEPPPPAPQHVPGEFYMWTPEEEMVALTAVRDEEVQAAKYISPEERARRAAEAAAEEEARRRAEADDARNRALKEMMNSNPAISRKSKGGKNRQVREAWMDMPPGQLNKEQRLKLAEWERKQQELAEELDKHRRLLEAERRALEVEIAEIAAGVNTDLTRLSNAKVRMDMEIVYLERRAADLADLMASLSAARAARDALTAQLAANTTRRTRRSPLLATLEAKVHAAQRAYEDVALSEKQVDKAFRREFSSRPELWDDAQKVYRARAHLLQATSSAGSLGAAAGAGGGGAGGGGGGPVTTARLPRKSALELLGKSPEGQALAAVLEAPGPGDVSVSQSTTSVAPVSRQSTLSRALTGRLTTIDSLGGSSSAGAPNPDVLLTTPRRPLRDMAHVARPLPRPGSALQAFLQKHLEPPKGSGGTAASGGGRTGNAPLTPPLAPATPRHGIGAVLIMAGEEAALARRGVSQRPAGLRLRALVEKEGRPLDRLLQMVADGLPPSALTAELGPLGLRLGSNMPGNLNPFKLEGPAGIFNPEATGAAEALADVGGAGGSSGSQAGGGSGSPVRERSSASGGRSTNNGSISPLKPEEGPEAEDEEEDPLDSKERPEGMDDSLWIRLLEFRQTRADLEMEAEEAWRRVSLLTAQLDWIEAEDASMEAAVEEAGARAAALRDGSTRLSLDVSLTYRLKNGQVELPERPGDVVGAGDVLADALILHRNRVESLNEEVLSRGESKIEVLEELRLMRRKIHLTQWETEAAELAGQHAAQRLTELQLLHVTKDLQAALRDPTIVDRIHEEDRLMSVRQNIANLHAHKLDQRRRQLGSLRARVTRSGTEQGELSVAEAAAEAAFQESTRMHLMMSHAKAAEDASHRRHMRAIVTNAQLRAIAQQQATDLERFGEQLRTAHARNFPALKPLLAWAPPDYRPPSAASAAAAAAMQQPSSRAPSRGDDQSTAMSTVASRPASAAMPLPGVQRRASSGLQARSSSGGGPASRPGSRAGTPPVPPRSGPLGGVTRSGGAGATLTRAYVLATGGGAMGTAGATAMGGGGVNGSNAARPPSSASRRL
ncbi:hypothetical protein Vretifemale_18579 [Volvox reticuliferus]|uniref:Uncharacterized protein n=2 Tax=Volvox reticuliferus TaxID=1737510 RepID=A0A8J4D1Q8_9CHLO|nr:hypothetical protein Vretifemale_18579 [Volvox reticuliferus]